jgi:hypothetical protein
MHTAATFTNSNRLSIGLSYIRTKPKGLNSKPNPHKPHTKLSREARGWEELLELGRGRRNFSLSRSAKTITKGVGAGALYKQRLASQPSLDRRRPAAAARRPPCRNGEDSGISYFNSWKGYFELRNKHSGFLLNGRCWSHAFFPSWQRKCWSGMVFVRNCTQNTSLGTAGTHLTSSCMKIHLMNKLLYEWCNYLK